MVCNSFVLCQGFYVTRLLNNSETSISLAVKMKVISVLSFVYIQWRVGPVSLVNIYSEEELITSLFIRIGFSSHTYFTHPLLAFLYGIKAQTLPKDFWGRKRNPCIAHKQQSGTLALTSFSNFSIEALTLTRLSLTSFVKIHRLSTSRPLRGVKRAVSVGLRTSQMFWYVCLVLGNCSLGLPLTSPTLSKGIRGYWLSQGTCKETGPSQEQFRTRNLALCSKFPPHNLKFSLPQCGAWRSGS